MTLRSLMIGDTDHYLSPYIHGVVAASGKLGILHSQISVRQDFAKLFQRIEDVRPHLLWTHMMLWPPEHSAQVMIRLCEMARCRFGCKVILHDGDYKERTRWPHDVSGAVDLALLNHRHDRSAWKVPTLYWPYACFPQDEIAKPVSSLRCELAFAGQVGGGIYDERSTFVRAIQAQGVNVQVFDGRDGNTLLRTADVAASADAILGFGRPGSDWMDNRVFQYPGAGAILLHDDVPADAGMVPWSGGVQGHYVSYKSGSVDSVIEALARLRGAHEMVRGTLRARAFDQGQRDHSYTARVKQVLDFFGMATCASLRR